MLGRNQSIWFGLGFPLKLNQTGSRTPPLKGSFYLTRGNFFLSHDNALLNLISIVIIVSIKFSQVALLLRYACMSYY